MYTVKKHCHMLNGGSTRVAIIGTGNKQRDAINLLRAHFLKQNQMLIDLSEKMEVPDAIINLAKQNIERNPDLNFTVREEDGVVFVDGQGPEMDYFTITED